MKIEYNHNTEPFKLTKMHEKLKQLRKKAKLTQSQVSLLMGVSVSRIRQIEQGKSVLKLNTIQRYCKAIGVSVGVRFE